MFYVRWEIVGQNGGKIKKVLVDFKSYFVNTDMMADSDMDFAPIAPICLSLFLIVSVTDFIWQLSGRIEPEEIRWLLSDVALRQSDSSEWDKPEKLAKRFQVGLEITVLLMLDIDRTLCSGYGASAVVYVRQPQKKRRWHCMWNACNIRSFAFLNWNDGDTYLISFGNVTLTVTENKIVLQALTLLTGVREALTLTFRNLASYI